MQDIPHSTRSLASANQSPDMSYLIPPYLALYISGGHIGLPILVGTLLFSKRIRRPPAVTNMLITWILESISYCLVLYTGPTIRQHPPFTLCLLQAAFVHAAPPTSVIAVFTVVLQVWCLFQPPWHPWLIYFARLSPRTRLLLVVVPPYIVFVLISIATIVVGLNNRESLTPNLGIYCTIDLEVFFAIPLLCGAFMILILFFNVGTIGQFYWRIKRTSHLQPMAHRGPSVRVWIRVFLFNLYSVATLGACLLFLVSASNPIPYMVQAGLPLVAFLLFSSQTDVFRVWCFWKREKERVSPRASQQPETSHGGWSAPTDADHLSSSSGNAISTTQNDRPPTTGDGDVIIIGPLTHIYDSGSELKGGGLNDSGRYHHANMIRTDALPARKGVKYSKSLMTCCDL